MLEEMSNKAFLRLLALVLTLIVAIGLLWSAWPMLSVADRYIGVVCAIVLVLTGLFFIVRGVQELVKHQEQIALTRHTRQLERETQEHQAKIEALRLQQEHERAMKLLDHQTTMEQQRFQLEQHIAMTRVSPTEHGYAALVERDITGYQVTQIPYAGRPQLVAASATGKDEQAAKQGKSAVWGDEPALHLPPPTDVYDLLQHRVWQPSSEQLLLAIGPDGPISIDYALAWHIALAGATGGGKTNELRLILAQMVMHSTVYYISPAFAPIKANKEDWRQIQQRLAGPVARLGHEIEFRLQWGLQELRRRQDAEFQGDYSWKNNRIYIVIDEYKEVIARYENAPNDISNLLRQARQYDIFVVVAAQDFLIKNIGGDSGARDCYRTALYFGGDPNTCRSLLDVQGTLPFEQDLGKQGHMVLRTKSTKVSQARAPFMSNRAIYTLLGWPDDPILDDAPVTPLHASWGPSRDNTGIRRDRDVEPDYRQSGASHTTVVEAVRNGGETRYTGPLKTPTTEPTQAVGTPVGNVPLGPNDKMMSDEQVGQFVRLYKRHGNIKECLRQMGIGNAYNRHASSIVQQYDLRKA